VTLLVQTLKDMLVIERLVSATACQMLKVTIAQSAGKTTGRLPVVRDAKIVLVILLDPLEISVTCTMDSVTADKALVEDDVTNVKTTSGGIPSESVSLVTVALWV